MKLLQLRYFYTACQYNNITEASRALFVSQPAITNAIRDLEEEFGVTLLQRLNRGVQLTEEGEFFLSRITELLKHADQVNEMMKDRGQKRKLIRLGVPPMIGTCLFPDIYKAFKLLYPEIQIDTREHGSRDLLKLLDRDYLDLVILPTNEIPVSDYNIINFSNAETVFCVSNSHSLADKKKVTVDDCLTQPLVLFHSGFYHTTLVNKIFRERGAEPNVIHTSTQLETIIQFIRKDIACGFLFDEVVNNSSGVRGISFDPPISIQVGLVCKKNHQMFTAMIDFIQFIKAGDFLSQK